MLFEGCSQILLQSLSIVQNGQDKEGCDIFPAGTINTETQTIRHFKLVTKVRGDLTIFMHCGQLPTTNIHVCLVTWYCCWTILHCALHGT